MNGKIRGWSSLRGLAMALPVVLGCGGQPAPVATVAPPAAPTASERPEAAPRPELGRTALREGWTLQSSAKVEGATGKDISKVGYATAGWYATTVPSTVFAALIANHVYPDPYVGNNLASVPSAPFETSWWYRTELVVPADVPPRAAWLDLDGVNYRANVWMNGQLIASSDDIVGTFAAYELDVTPCVRFGEKNALAIEVLPPDLKTDLAITWLDWNPGPPDRDMGLWQGVSLRRTGPVALRKTHVQPRLEESLDAAHLTIKAELTNATGEPVHTMVDARVAGIEVTQEVDLAGHETRTVTFEPTRYPVLDLAKPRLWWPAKMGAQDLYDAKLEASVSGRPSDRASVRFGIRNVTFEPTKDGYRLFRVNGKPFFVRGGGWSSDMMLRPITAERLEAELDYVQDLGLNTIRLEGKLESDAFFDRADERGIVTLPGWMCCDRWQDWPIWTPNDHRIAVRSMQSQAERLRSHASVFDFLIGSDEPPTAEVQEELREVLSRSDWPNPVSQSASDDGVKMTGPYDWVPPSYWYVDRKKYGGAWGFNTETSPGPAIPELESLAGMLTPEDQVALWSQPKAPQFHAGTRGTEFDNLSIFNAALAGRHGAPSSLADYVRKAQLMNYEAERAEYEAYSRNKYAPATGVVHWMLNNAWPSLIWHLYGSDLAVAAGYFGAKKGNEPVHIQYSYDDRSVVVVNQTQEPKKGLEARVRVVELDAKVGLDQRAAVSVGADAVATVLTVPPVPPGRAPYFVVLTLTEGDRTVSSSLYWLSRRPETMNFAKPVGTHDIPSVQFADYRDLARLAAVTLEARARAEVRGADGETRVTLENRTPSIAFFVRLKLTRGTGGEQVVPVLWEDNYVSLLPGEKRELRVRYNAADLRGARPSVDVSGWNVAKVTLDASAGK